MKRIGIFAGSFDPPTNGHRWMMERGAELFDELIVVPAVNPEKKGLFSAEERCAMLNRLIEDLPAHVRVEPLTDGFLVDLAERVGAKYLLRGIRTAADFDYEKSMARLNARLKPGVQTIFLTPPSELEDLSSSFVRGFVGTPGWERWVRACVPPCIAEMIEQRG